MKTADGRPFSAEDAEYLRLNVVEMRVSDDPEMPLWETRELTLEEQMALSEDSEGLKWNGEEIIGWPDVYEE